MRWGLLWALFLLDLRFSKRRLIELYRTIAAVRTVTVVILCRALRSPGTRNRIATPKGQQVIWSYFKLIIDYFRCWKDYWILPSDSIFISGSSGDYRTGPGSSNARSNTFWHQNVKRSVKKQLQHRDSGKWRSDVPGLLYIFSCVMPVLGERCYWNNWSFVSNYPFVGAFSPSSFPWWLANARNCRPPLFFFSGDKTLSLIVFACFVFLTNYILETLWSAFGEQVEWKARDNDAEGDQRPERLWRDRGDDQVQRGQWHENGHHQPNLRPVKINARLIPIRER